MDCAIGRQILIARKSESESAIPGRFSPAPPNRPGQPFLGSGETGQGPAAASIANAIANATGKRLRDLPLTQKRIKEAIDA
jgi:nicotinate dehydrogenase subunit B